MSTKLSRARARISGRYALAVALVLALAVPAVAFGVGEGRPLLGGKRNPAGGGVYSAETQIISSNNGYSTRQSNKGSGGGAIYGCRASATSDTACVRANNLSDGRAFDFVTSGKLAGRITVTDTTAAPLTTNATGVATGLNADRVDGKEATDFAGAGDLKFAVVALDGNGRAVLSAARGATAVTGPTGSATTVTFGTSDLSKCAFTASPTGASQAAAYGVSLGADSKSVVVRQPGGAQTGFHLQVMC